MKNRIQCSQLATGADICANTHCHHEPGSGVNQMKGKIMDLKCPWTLFLGNYPEDTEKYKSGLEVMLDRKERFKTNQHCGVHP
jgi:hypothetical protein